jgi:hypothetical protein
MIITHWKEPQGSRLASSLTTTGATSDVNQSFSFDNRQSCRQENKSPFYRVLERGSCHRTSRRMQTLYKRDKASGLSVTMKDTSCTVKLLVDTGLLDISNGSLHSSAR